MPCALETTSCAGAPRRPAEPFARAFSTTQWSVVLLAAQGGLFAMEGALEELCRKYWYPLYAFVRRRGFDPHEAEDLTQSFFAFFLEKETLKKVDRQKGKFRSFLLASLTNFLNNDWDKRHTLKSGGRRRIFSLDGMDPEERFALEPVEPSTPEMLFERRWALTLVEQVLGRLRQEYVAAGKAQLFAALATGLTGEVVGQHYDQWTVALGMSQGALKVALHRLRRRFGQLLREEIAQTVANQAEVDEEIRQLFALVAT
jgi:DNA-directed RNA polymerase specialized sigma24 family protein